MYNIKVRKSKYPQNKTGYLKQLRKLPQPDQTLSNFNNRLRFILGA